MGFSPDGRLLYHADSGEHTVYVYDVKGDGSLSNRRSFASVRNGLPDGLAIDTDGSVWLAVAHAGQVVVFAADGSIVRQLDFPPAHDDQPVLRRRGHAGPICRNRL